MLKKHFKIWAIIATIAAAVFLILLVSLGFLYIGSLNKAEAKEELGTGVNEINVTEERSMSCCYPIYVDLDHAPEGTWSNASAILLAEGWSIVIERNQLWEQSKGVSWKDGATQDFLLLSNEGPGARYFSLQDSFGGRPRNWWNDQAKRFWLFSSNCQVLEGKTVAVLYEHDDGQEGWQYAITLDMALAKRQGEGAFAASDAAISNTFDEIAPTATPVIAPVPTAIPAPERSPAIQAAPAPACLFVGQTLVSSDKVRVETNETGNFYDTSFIEVSGEVEVIFENWDGGNLNWSETMTLGPGTYDLTSIEGGRYDDRLQKICASNPAQVVLAQHHDKTGKTATIIFQ